MLKAASVKKSVSPVSHVNLVIDTNFLRCWVLGCVRIQFLLPPSPKKHVVCRCHQVGELQRSNGDARCIGELQTIGEAYKDHLVSNIN